MTIRIFMLSFIIALAEPALVAAAPPSSGRGGPAKRETGTPRATRDEAKQGRKKTPRGLAFRALRMNIETAVFDGMTLEEFAEWLERTTKANVVVKWKVLEEAGVTPDVAIHLRLKNVSVRKLLQLVFSQVAGATEGVELAVKADDNTLIISTRRDLSTELVTRLYDVQAMLIIVPHFTGQGPGDPTTGGRSTGGGRAPGPGMAAGGGGRGSGGGGGRGGGGGGSGGRGGGERRTDTVEQKAERLIHLITSSIEPESWAVNGGKGTIAYYKGQLVVRNNLIVHEQLGGVAPPPRPRASTQEQAGQ